MLRARPRYLSAIAMHATYATGLRGYCFQHDVLHWGWTHRHCCERAHREAAIVWRRTTGGA